MLHPGYVANSPSKFRVCSVYRKSFLLTLSCRYSYLPDKSKTIRDLLSICGFPAHITSVFIQNASKILSKLAMNATTDNREFLELCNDCQVLLEPSLRNQNLEIQERSATLSQIIMIYKELCNKVVEQQIESLIGDSYNEDDIYIKQKQFHSPETLNEKVN